MRFTRFAKLLVALALLAATLPAQPKGGWFAYVGTYTRQKSKGIYVYKYDPATGKLTNGTLAAETSNPSFLAVSPDQKYLYAANENNQGKISKADHT